MSPEQARGDHDLTTATDVYALGATLVYTLTGHTVYQQTNPIALLRRIDASGTVPAWAGVLVVLTLSCVGSMLAFRRTIVGARTLRALRIRYADLIMAPPASSGQSPQGVAAFVRAVSQGSPASPGRRHRRFR
jgi:serine/threonine protein kinase